MKSEPRHLVDYRRLAKRNLASLLRYKFLYEYGYDKGAVVAAAIVDDICATVRAYYRRAGDLEPGQLIYNAAAKDERGGRGKTMAKTRLVPVRLTLIADEDLDAIRQHLPFTVRREIRIRRLAHEAARQGAALTEADLALLMGNCSDGLISGVVSRLRKTGEWLPLRGYVADMGSFPTHKAAIVALYLQGLTTPDIASRTYHSKEAVDRYIRGFDRVRLLAPKYAPEELPLLTGMSMPLIQQYLTLLEEHGLLDTRPRRGARRAVSS